MLRQAHEGLDVNVRKRTALLEQASQPRPPSASGFQESLRGLINATTQSALLLDLDCKVLAINEEGACCFGSTPEALRGQSLKRFFIPELYQARRAFFDQLMASGRPVSFVDRRGPYLLENKAYPLFDPEGRVYRVAVFHQDIIQQEQAEAELEHSLSLLAAALESTAEDILVTDALGRTQR